MPTGIEWCEETWNPVTGCSACSPGCEHCYARRMASRLAGRYGYPRDEPFKVTLHPDKLTVPLRWRRPRVVMVVSMGDLFHEDVPDSYIDGVFGVMTFAPWHTFLVLTKRPERMAEYLAREAILHDWVDAARRVTPDKLRWRRIEECKAVYPMPNVMLGVTVCNQAEADAKVPLLLATPAARRFVSIEPMLGPVEVDFPKGAYQAKYPDDFASWSDERKDEWFQGTARATYIAQCALLDGVIVGGESGPGARPMHPEWARGVRDECEAAGVAFTFKQWGAWMTWGGGDACFDGEDSDTAARRWPECAVPPGLVAYRVGKKAAGRVLDGVVHDAFPWSLLEAKP